VADDDVHQAERPRPLRDRTRFVGRAVVHDDDFDRTQGLLVQQAIVGARPEPPLKVGMITLTEALPAGIPALGLRTPNRASDTSDSV
jgi:hypothetical protein